MIEPKTAEERVKVVEFGRNDYRVVVDGATETEKWWHKSSAAKVATERIALIDTTVEMCCAAQCPHCRNSVPFIDDGCYHRFSDGKLVPCYAPNIRKNLGVKI